MDFSQCLIDVTTCPKGTKLVDFFSELKAVPKIEEYSDDEIKIAVSISDFDSPFIKKISDAEMRLNAIVDFFSIAADEKFLGQILSWKNDHITNFVSSYLQMQADQDWRRYLNLERLCSQLQDELSRPINFLGDEVDADVKRKLAIEKNIDEIIEKLKKYESRLFPDRNMKRAIIINEMTKIISYPERYAQDRQVI